jgi:hypothetical protein
MQTIDEKILPATFDQNILGLELALDHKSQLEAINEK